jgi:hypothetical protein
MGPWTAVAAETALKTKAAERRARVFITILPNLRNFCFVIIAWFGVSGVNFIV